ncbi:Magnesium and cobalt efflux protein CorC [Buchnera aphidicola (Thelaxes suberi)]|uniref:CNNM family magnesium/cobalt transport protein CorC n=1 Tax=Buchnera aphidicola TaxID=9 RepID=UPI003463EB7E
MSNDHAEYENKESNKKGFFSFLKEKFFNKKPKNKKDVLYVIHNSEKKELIDPTIKNMLTGIMSITKQKVKEIMIPRSQMITLDINHNLQQCLDIIIQSAHSRFPVMNAEKNDVKGFLMAKDLLPFIKNKSETFSIKKILRPAVIVPESKNVDSMLKEFRLRRFHIAIVIDEFGTLSGLITIEDVLELIVGEIEDEYDRKNEINIQPIDNNTFSISALTETKEFNEKFKTCFGNHKVDTVGGFIMQAFGRIPKKNEIININQFQFKVIKVNSRRIVQLQLKINKNKETNTNIIKNL